MMTLPPVKLEFMQQGGGEAEDSDGSEEAEEGTVHEDLWP